MRYSERIVDVSRPGKYFLLFIFFFLLMAINAIGQTKEEKKLRAQAVKALNSGKFEDAEKIYTDLLKLSPDNPDYNYEMGLALYEGSLKRSLAASYFERAIVNMKTDTLPDMFLYAGKAEQYSGRLDIAIDYYHTYLRLMERTAGLEPGDLEEDVERYIEMCQNGKVQFENNKQFIRIENMGPSINSIYADYSPVVNSDESVILFTSRREGSTGGAKDYEDNYFEDIYYSVYENGAYTAASNVDSSSRFINSAFNTESHDATITYAGNETQLFIYRDQDVWVSTRDNDMWTIPVRAHDRINSDNAFEPSVFITQDQQTMFVVSDLSTGYGNRDIYITHRDEAGNWMALRNLGKLINTRYDEDAPFLTPDGNTLYFASKGHNSMGDYDIFKSVLDENGEWSAPENLGPPINTPGHDRYFVTTDNGAVGYYASDRDGTYGETDIYRIVLDCKAVSATKIRGSVYSEDKGGPVASTITIFDPKTNVIIHKYSSDPVSGKYEMRLKTETTYGFKIEAEGYFAHMGEFTVPKQCEYYSLFQEVKIETLTDSSGRAYAQRAFINNAFFDIDQKITEDYEEVVQHELNEFEKDSLRSVIAASYNPIELTNYIQLIEILDPKGIRLDNQIIGDKDVALIQTRDELVLLYTDKIMEADRHFYSNHLPEARANYLIAAGIRPDEAYPQQQLAIIETKMRDADAEAMLASLPEDDESRFIVPQLIDSSAIVIPSDIAAVITQPAPEPVVIPSPEPKESNTTNAPVAAAEPPAPAVIEAEPVESLPAEKQPEAVAVATTPEPVQPPTATEPPKPAEPQKVTPTEAQPEETIVFRNILFDFDKSDLRQASIQELIKISDYMKGKNEVVLEIDGHADWIGTVEYNLALSERRAKAAYDYLVSRGIAEGQLTYQYFGESVPIAPNENADGTDNPDGRQLNRRCEFKLDQTGTAENVVLKF